ncbi:transporter substrate-binding domain-containing protein [Flammeovirga kamogawensis]|uniref:Transporter substrate-binding domain-containing protein n=1 Tax=Flammeovirga kamogawensis TaxID=373891 RepID=A0ABX8GWD4_9BACT|nr:transporter substrate-binding domain-containing protein [Flammeovirga kamogawensis]MBB6461052.1 ABC-type amino acid transport substrate-binding protein [Flammeovirga kamogawensis]QWG07622.1 transporter substrate-binding domain-containing protein [Flammeovirga kamogawensis]TRX69432.1 transporter substrate-binding domain-containing protein [Flammeovirga kamogawensis]
MKLYLLLLFTFSPILLFSQNSGTERRTILENHILRVGVREDPPFVIKGIDGTFYGLSIDLWHMVAEDLHLVYEFVEYEHMPGLILGLSRKQIDISANPMPVSSTRIRQLDVTYPFMTTSLGVVVLKDKQDQLTIFFSNLFSVGFMKLFFTLIIIVFLFGTLVWWVEKKYNAKDFRDGIEGIMDGIWWSTVTITTVGYGDKTPKTTIGRVISMVWMFVAISLISSFTATITSTLTLNQLEAKIKSVSDLRKMKGNIGVTAHSGAESYLLKHQINPSTFSNPEDGLLALESGKIIAFVHDKPIMRYIIKERSGEDLFEISQANFKQNYYSLFMPRNSKLYKKINSEIVDNIDKDSWHRLLKKYNMDEIN